MEHRRSEKRNDAVMTQAPEYVLIQYDVAFVTETLLTEEWQPDGFYAAPPKDPWEDPEEAHRD
jgi:hypothetical protein